MPEVLHPSGASVVGAVVGKMSQSAISNVDVPFFEEYLDDASNIVTQYVINVKIHTPVHSSYQLRRRYNEFFKLFTDLKDKYPQVETFRFPHKSMFNTHSQYTKERRRQGFDDFLKVLLLMRPLPVEVEEFLELDDHINNVNNNTGSSSNYANHSTASLATAPVPSSSSSGSSFSFSFSQTATSTDQVSAGEQLTDGGKVSTPLTPTSRPRSQSVTSKKGFVSLSQAKAEKGKILWNFLPRCVGTTLVIYMLLVWTGVIDASGTTFRHMALTVAVYSWTAAMILTLLHLNRINQIAKDEAMSPRVDS